MRDTACIKVAMASRRGFSLIELALVLGISGLMLGFVLQSQQSAAVADCYAATKLQLSDINGALQRFARQRERLPMPASRTVGVEGPTYGREASGGAIDSVAGTSWGALPFQALGLAPSYASDCWGNKLTYVVTTALTTNAMSGGYLDATITGNITVLKDATSNSSTTAAYAVISHGEDALGAVKNNYSSAAKGWCTGGATLTTQNCLANAATVASATFNDGRDAGAAYFDDVIVTSGRPQVLNNTNVYCWGPNASGQLGVGNTNQRLYPMPVNAAIPFSKLYGSGDGFCALTSDGTPYCWGANTGYRLGSASCNACNPTSPAPGSITEPTIVPGGFKFTKLFMFPTRTCGIVAAGGSGTAGELRCWGQRDDSGTTLLIPNSTLVAGRSYGTPQPLGGTAAGRTFTDLFAGGVATYCAIEAGGGTNNTWCWGRNASGEWGNSTTSNGTGGTQAVQSTHGLSVRKLVFMGDAGSVSVCALTNSKQVYCWGFNNNGRLGLGHNGYGNGYALPPAVVISGGGGTGAAATAVLNNGGVVNLTLTSGGSGYTSAPTVTIDGVSGLTGALVNAGAVTGFISASSAGSFVLFSRNLVPTEVLGGRFYNDIASSAHSVCGIEDGTNRVYCWGGHRGFGLIANGVTTQTGSGTGYTSAPTVNFTSTTGSGAAATATISGGRVTGLTLTSRGSGYPTGTNPIEPFVALNGGGGFGARATAVKGGPISGFTITNAGSGYTPGTYDVTANIIETSSLPLAVTPPTGCNATIGAGGTLTGITCSTFGSGYRTPTITLPAMGGGTGATATVQVAQTEVVNLSVVTNDGDVFTPTLVSGAVNQFTSIYARDVTFSALATDGRLYSWGAGDGGNYYTGVNGGGTLFSPTLLNSFRKLTTCNATTCGTGDITAAGVTFTSLCSSGSDGMGSLFCALDATGRSYMWRQYPGTGISTRSAIPEATCPDQATSGMPGCSFSWSTVVGNRGEWFNVGSSCAIRAP